MLAHNREQHFPEAADDKNGNIDRQEEDRAQVIMLSQPASALKLTPNHWATL